MCKKPPAFNLAAKAPKVLFTQPQKILFGSISCIWWRKGLFPPPLGGRTGEWITWRRRLPVFRGLNPRDVKVKDIRELVADLLKTTPTIQYYNPLFIPIGDITGIMWADLDDYLDVDLRAIVDNQPLRVDINAGVYGSTGVFNLQDYQYEATQVNEIYEGIREVVDNDSNAEWNGRVMVRKGFQDDGNAESYFLQFVLNAGGQEIEPTDTFEESIGVEIPKETQEQRRARLKGVIARKKELAQERRKKQKEK